MRRVALLTAVCCLTLAACGNERTRPPDVATPQSPSGERRVVLKDAGVRFHAPANWTDMDPQGSRAGGIRSRTATVAVWRYERTEPLPRGGAALERAERMLLDRIRRRDPGFQLRSSRTTRRAGTHAIEVVGSQTIAGLPFDVRSTHVFKHGAEVVVDAYAPPGEFERVDRTVFLPLLRSLRLDAP